MKWRLRLLMLPVAALLLSSCAAMLGPQEMEIPLSKLQESIARRVPIDKHVAQFLDLRITNPQVSVVPGTDRILTSMDTSISPPLTSKSWSGNLAISGLLEIDQNRHAVVLAEPRVEKFTVNGLDTQYANQLTRLGNLVAEQLLENVPLYTFTPEQLTYAGTRFHATGIKTKANGIVVTFEPTR